MNSGPKAPMSRRPAAVNTERSFLLDELFFSTTDLKGIISDGNEVFVRVSNYTREDLMSKPHNVIRHPDMPRAVFRLLWQYLQNGKSIVAYVKNMASDGCYYWVCALVAPINGGYLSIRLKPSSPLFAKVESLYRELLEIEQRAEAAGESKQQAMDASTAHLENALKSHGFADYDQFMKHVLTEEACSRKKKVARKDVAGKTNLADSGKLRQVYDACHHLQSQSSTLFAAIDPFLSLEKNVADRVASLKRLGMGLKYLSLNAELRAASLQEQGRMLQVVAVQMCNASAGLLKLTTEVCDDLAEFTGALRSAAFAIAANDLSIEMMSVFLNEQSAAKANTNVSDFMKRLAQLAQVVALNLDQSCTCALIAAKNVHVLQARLEHFLIEIRTLEILHLSGRMESVACENARDVSMIFKDVHTKTQEARTQLSELLELVSRAKIVVPDRSKLDQDLRQLSAAA